MNISVLVDDRKGKEGCFSEHGLSLYIEVDGKRILMDTGQSNVFMKNANKLDIKLDKVDIVVLSHGHYDHSNGLKYIKNGKTLICHPSSFVKRYSINRQKYAGIDMSKEELVDKFELVLSKGPYKIDEDIVYMGEIPRKNDFESKEFPTVYIDGTVDIVEDDSGIVIKTDKGLVVISGCAHSGICNTIEYAKKIMNEDKIYAVIGGFHLKKLNEQVTKTIEYFKANNINKSYLGHCTSNEVCNKFKESLSGNIVQVMGVGLQYKL